MISLELELFATNNITSAKVIKFQKQLAKVCGMYIFCGPMVIAPDTRDYLKVYYPGPKFKTTGWCAYSWWTDYDSNLMAISDHVHQAFYYYPESNLIKISLASLKDLDTRLILNYCYKYWQPNDAGIKYAYVSSETSNYKWKVYGEK